MFESPHDMRRTATGDVKCLNAVGERQSRLSGIGERGRRPTNYGADGTVRLRRVGDDGSQSSRFAPHFPPNVNIEAQENRHRLVVGPLDGEPTSVRVDATFVDRFGLRASAHAISPELPDRRRPRVGGECRCIS